MSLTMEWRGLVAFSLGRISRLLQGMFHSLVVEILLPLVLAASGIIQVFRWGGTNWDSQGGNMLALSIASWLGVLIQ